MWHTFVMSTSSQSQINQSDPAALVLTSVFGTATGVITLHRPKALNSLNHEMVRLIRAALDNWRNDPAIAQVVIVSGSERAFCAGGDVRTVREEGLRGDYLSGDEFFRDEYDMNYELATYPKPLIAFIDGVAMGGGLGVSSHGSHRVITSKAWAAMPEMVIGFVPDVGMTHMMTHMAGPGRTPSTALGTFLAVTGWHLSAADMMAVGMATHHVAATQEELLSAIDAQGPDAITNFAAPLEAASLLAPHFDAIERSFGFGTWEEIQAAVAAESQEFQQLVAEHVAKANPLSVVAAVLACHRAGESDLRPALDNELRLGMELRRSPNFAEGVRAVLVDKDRDSHFDPATFDAITDEQRDALIRCVH